MFDCSVGRLEVIHLTEIRFGDIVHLKKLLIPVKIEEGWCTTAESRGWTAYPAVWNK